MIPVRADGANVNDLVTVRPLTRPGTSLGGWLKQTFGGWLGWGADQAENSPAGDERHTRCARRCG